MTNEEILNAYFTAEFGNIINCKNHIGPITFTYMTHVLDLMNRVKIAQKQEDIEIAKTYYQQGSLGYTVGQQIAQAIFDNGK